MWRILIILATAHWSACGPAISGEIAEYDYCGADIDGVDNCEHRVFFTDDLYNTNVGGLSGMDSKCRDAAVAAGLERDYVAIASDSNVDAKDRIPAQGALYNFTDAATRVRIVSDMSLLWGASPVLEAAILYSNLYNTTAGVLAWMLTGTNKYGTKLNDNCNNWAATAGFNFGRGNTHQSDSSWINQGAVSGCTAVLGFRIYCVSK